MQLVPGAGAIMDIVMQPYCFSISLLVTNFAHQIRDWVWKHSERKGSHLCHDSAPDQDAELSQVVRGYH